jgi:hypothetical protein
LLPATEPEEEELIAGLELIEDESVPVLDVAGESATKHTAADSVPAT